MLHSLLNLTTGDRIAGESKIPATIITPVKVELLFECTSAKLSQIVGRMKFTRCKHRGILSKEFYFRSKLRGIKPDLD
jgi:hypothetical protein